MGSIGTRGFTVIELMLFLGITGALFAALMIGSNSTISQQRYRESVRDYGALLQDQYAEVLNTRNERDSKWRCVEGVVNPDPISGEYRGTSRCVLLGKAIEVTDDGTNVKVTSVIGYAADEEGALQGDIETLVAYAPKIPDDYDTNLTRVSWNSQLMTTDGQPSTASFLILRSPASGLIRVFASDQPLPVNLAEMITPTTATAIITNCVQGDSGTLPTQSVTVDPRISGPNGVIVNEVDEAC